MDLNLSAFFFFNYAASYYFWKVNFPDYSGIQKPHKNVLAAGGPVISMALEGNI